jgi:hypothetical protein
MEKQIETAVKRGRAYWFTDGFTEMAAGGLFVLLGAVILLRGLVPQASFSEQMISAGVDIAILKAAGILVIVLGLWWLKDRFTYPRTGYVRGRAPLAEILVLIRNIILVPVLPLMGVAAAFFLLPAARGALFSLPVWLPPLLGTVWGVLCYALGEWAGLRRFRLLGIAILVAGIALGGRQLLIGLPVVSAEALASHPWNALPEALQASLVEAVDRAFTSIGWLTLIAGIAFLLSGLVTFLRYRKENPVPYQEES